MPRLVGYKDEGLWVFVKIFLFVSIVTVMSRKLTDDKRPVVVHFSWENEFNSWWKILNLFSVPVHMPNLSSMKRRRIVVSVTILEVCACAQSMPNITWHMSRHS